MTWRSLTWRVGGILQRQLLSLLWSGQETRRPLQEEFSFFFLEVEVVDGSHTRSPCAQDNSFFFHPYNTAFENNVCWTQLNPEHQRVSQLNFGSWLFLSEAVMLSDNLMFTCPNSVEICPGHVLLTSVIWHYVYSESGLVIVDLHNVWSRCHLRFRPLVIFPFQILPLFNYCLLPSFLQNF